MTDKEINDKDTTKDLVKVNVTILEKELKKAQRGLKRAETNLKRAETFESELKEQRKEFDNIADTNMVYATTDKDLIVTEASQAFCALTGYSQADIIGQKFNIMIDREDAHKFSNGCEYVSTHNKEAWGTDIKMLGRDYNVLYTHTFIYPLFESGVLKGFTFVSQDIHDTYILNQYKVEQLTKEQYTETTMEFMKGTSVAILNTVNSKVSMVVKIIFFIIMMFFIYAISFDIEEIVKGDGQVIPTNKVQSIKNKEGGIVSAILVKEGDRIKKGQIILKLSDESYKNQLAENMIRISELQAKEIRLRAESTNTPFVIDQNFEYKYPKLMSREKARYITNKKEQKSKIGKYYEQLSSKKSEADDAKNAFYVLEENYLSRAEELEESEKLANQGVFSKYDIASIKREVNDMLSGVVSAKEKRIQIKNSINEIKNSINETKLGFQNKAKETYSDTVSEINKLKEMVKNIQDTKGRTLVRTPVDGVVKDLLVNTIGSSVNPSEELITIVPDNADMVSEIKIAPENIGKLYVGQRILLKVTAFDYALYGNLEGEITNISPDTTLDKQSGNTHYLVQVKTKRDYLNNDKKNKLKVGMKVNTDIIVGKKTILEFVLKPVLRSTE